MTKLRTPEEILAEHTICQPTRGMRNTILASNPKAAIRDPKAAIRDAQREAWLAGFKKGVSCGGRWESVGSIYAQPYENYIPDELRGEPTKGAKQKPKEKTMSDIENLSIKEARDLIAKAGEVAKVMGGEAPKSSGPLEQKRVVLVVDRGWIFAGDQSRTEDGHVRLSNAVHVFRWKSIGFAGMVQDWRNDKVELRPCADVEVPEGCVIFRVPVDAGWGLK